MISFVAWWNGRIFASKLIGRKFTDPEFDTDNELDDCGLLDAMLNDGTDEDDNVTQDLFGRMWKTVRTRGKFHGHCWTSRCCKTWDRDCGHF